MDYRSAYGLLVATELPLDDLPVAAGDRRDPDVVIERGNARVGETSRLEGGLEWRIDDGNVAFRWDGAGTIVVSGGNRIIVDAPVNVDRRAIALMLQGPGLNAIIRQRGMVMLHAAGIDIEGRCCAIVGASGMGKSTLAAALGRRGYALIADDGVVVDGRIVRPAFPTMKLWPESANHLDMEGTPLLEGGAKLRVDAQAFHERSLPIGSIVLLADGEDSRTERIGGALGAVELIANASRAIALEGLDPVGHFRACTRIARVIPVCRLYRRRNLDHLDDLADRVVAFASGEGNEL